MNHDHPMNHNNHHHHTPDLHAPVKDISDMHRLLGPARMLQVLDEQVAQQRAGSADSKVGSVRTASVDSHHPCPPNHPADVRVGAPSNGAPGNAAPKQSRLVEFWATGRFRDFAIPADYNMVGDFHIQKGMPFVLAGAPGTGKSRAAVALALAGAMGQGTSWFGHTVHTQFRTMILQCENGPVRLRRELEDIPAADHDLMNEWVRISPPPPQGFRFDTPQFLAQLGDAIAEFRPQLFVLDPWTRLAEDDKAADYRRAFDLLLGSLPEGDEMPAIGIVAHTRKPRPEERASGRTLLHVVSGSFVLTAAARSVFVLQHASDDSEETRVVMTCAKNNDGLPGPRSAWERRNGLFVPAGDFDWVSFDEKREKQSKSVTSEHLKVFEKGPLPRTAAIKKLMEIASVSQSTAYRTLDPEGEFSALLDLADGLLTFSDPFDE